jgi:hypothetical protein
MLYRDTVAQAQVLAYVDEFRLLSAIFFVLLLFIPFMRRIHTQPTEPRKAERVEGLREPGGEAPHGLAAVE